MGCMKGLVLDARSHPEVAQHYARVAYTPVMHLLCQSRPSDKAHVEHHLQRASARHFHGIETHEQTQTFGLKTFSIAVHPTCKGLCT